MKVTVEVTATDLSYCRNEKELEALVIKRLKDAGATVDQTLPFNYSGQHGRITRVSCPNRNAYIFTWEGLKP